MEVLLHAKIRKMNPTRGSFIPIPLPYYGGRLSRMLATAVSCALFSSVRVGLEEVEVSLLQYADDSIIFGEAKVETYWCSRVYLDALNGTRA